MARKFNLTLVLIVLILKSTFTIVFCKDNSTHPQIVQLAIEEAIKSTKDCAPTRSVDYIKELFEKGYENLLGYDVGCVITCTMSQMHVLNDNFDFDPKEVLKLGDKIQGTGTNNKNRLGQMFAEICGKVEADSVCDTGEKIYNCLKDVNAKWMKLK